MSIRRPVSYQKRSVRRRRRQMKGLPGAIWSCYSWKKKKEEEESAWCGGGKGGKHGWISLLARWRE